jgi:CBS domain-containing protein
MKARDVMTTHVITISPNATIQEVAEFLLQHRISALPVVNQDGALVGIVSEGDLLRRSEVGTDRRRSWWLRMLVGQETLAAEYVKAHAGKVADVMTKRVITAEPMTPLSEIATLLERHSIKRIPIVENARLVGIVTRANLVQAYAVAHKKGAVNITHSDTMIRDKLMERLRGEPWARTWLLNVIVQDGVVDLWGMVGSDAERNAIRVAAETMPAVRAVNDHLVQQPLESGAY